MNTKLYRLKKNFSNWIKKTPIISELDEDVYNIAKKLIVTSATELTIDPLVPKFYIYSKKEEIFISIEEKHFKIVYGNKNYFDITVSATIANKTISLFKRIQQRRTQKMEDYILSNIAGSIKKINNKIKI